MVPFAELEKPLKDKLKKAVSVVDSAARKRKGFLNGSRGSFGKSVRKTDPGSFSMSISAKMHYEPGQVENLQVCYLFCGCLL